MLFTHVFFQDVAILLVTELVLGIAMHEWIVVVVLRSIIFHGETDVFVIHVELEILACNWILEEIRPGLGKRLLKVELDKLLAGRLATTGSTSCLRAPLPLSLGRLAVRTEDHAQKVLVDVAETDCTCGSIPTPLIDDKEDDECEEETYQQKMPPVILPKLTRLL